MQHFAINSSNADKLEHIKLSSLDPSLGSNWVNLEQWSCRWRSPACSYIKGYTVSSSGTFLLAGILQSLLCSFCCTLRRLLHQTCYRASPFMPSWMLESYTYSFSDLSGGMMVQLPASYGDEHAAYVDDFEWPLRHRSIDCFGFGAFLEEPWLHATHSRCSEMNCCQSCNICQDSGSMLFSGRVWLLHHRQDLLRRVSCALTADLPLCTCFCVTPLKDLGTPSHAVLVLYRRCPIRASCMLFLFFHYWNAISQESGIGRNRPCDVGETGFLSCRRKGHTLPAYICV